WDVIVGGHLDERVKGPIYEEYHNTRTTKVEGDADECWGANLISYVAGTTTQTYHGEHKMYSWGGRTDEVGGGSLTQIYHGPVTTNMFATWDVTADRNITITSTKGEVTITSPTNISLNALNVTIKGAKVKVAAATYEGVTGPTHDWFSAKTSAGVF